MIELKCPFCGDELAMDYTGVMYCCNQNCGKAADWYGSKILWQKLIRTRKALDIASAQNVPGPIKLYVCADGSVYSNLDVAKSHAASIFNPLPAGATTTDRVYLERELDCTRKALEIAVDALKSAQQYICSDKKSYQIIQTALEQITALEQKEG